MQRPKYSEETILSISKTTLTNARNNLDALVEFGGSEAMLNQFESEIQTKHGAQGLFTVGHTFGRRGNVLFAAECLRTPRHGHAPR